MSLNANFKINWQAILIVTILLTGIAARFWDLSGHFTHIDDIGVAKSILDFKSEGKSAVWAVPLRWTYAPFQFLFTQFLVSMDQSYRMLLFWGRLPSAVFGSLGLLVLLSFYRRYDSFSTCRFLTASVLLACSWEAIIMAKQMHNYALGATAAIIFTGLFVCMVSRKKYAIKSLVISAAILAVLTYMQYSLVMFIPAFFLALLVSGWKEHKSKVVLIRNLALGALSYVLFVFPAYHFFLSKQFQEGKAGLYDWNKGVGGEFFFQWPQAGSFFAKIGYTVTFYAKNFFGAFAANIGFLPEGSILFLPVVSLLFICFIAGLISYIRTHEENKRYLGLFLGLLILVWFVFVGAQRVTFSPTRHNLIFLPMMAITTAEGVQFIFRKIGKAAHVILAGLVLAAFLFSFPTFLKERKDPFYEKEIFDIVQRYEVDSVVASSWTNHIELMKDVRDHFRYYHRGLREHYLVSDGPQPYKRILWISHSENIDPQIFKKTANYINAYFFAWNRSGRPAMPFFKYPLEAYKIIYMKEIPEGVEVEFSQQTKNRGNGLYMYVLEGKF